MHDRKKDDRREDLDEVLEGDNSDLIGRRRKKWRANECGKGKQEMSLVAKYMVNERGMKSRRQASDTRNNHHDS